MLFRLPDYAHQSEKPVAGYRSKPAVSTRVFFTAGCLLVFSISMAGSILYCSQYQLRKVVGPQARQYNSFPAAKRSADGQATAEPIQTFHQLR